MISLRPSFQNQMDAASNPHYFVSGESINGFTTSILFYEPTRSFAFSNLLKRRSEAVVGKEGTPKSVGAIGLWLEKQDAYTLHRPVRKRFACNSYTVTKVMDVWEFDLVNVQAYSKYNDKHRYILS